MNMAGIYNAYAQLSIIATFYKQIQNKVYDNHDMTCCTRTSKYKTKS